MDIAVGARHDPALTLPPDEKHELPPSVHAVEKPPVLGGWWYTAFPGREFPCLSQVQDLADTGFRK
jgi:hypothetical protein